MSLREGRRQGRRKGRRNGEGRCWRFEKLQVFLFPSFPPSLPPSPPVRDPAGGWRRGREVTHPWPVLGHCLLLHAQQRLGGREGGREKGREGGREGEEVSEWPVLEAATA